MCSSDEAFLSNYSDHVLLIYYKLFKNQLKMKSYTAQAICFTTIHLYELSCVHY